MIRPFVLSALVVASLAATTPSADFSADRFKAHVTFLADDLLEGRETGTRGHAIAARYIAAQFAVMGIKPGGTNGSYYETVDLLEYTLAGPTGTIVVSTPKGTQ